MNIQHKSYFYIVLFILFCPSTKADILDYYLMPIIIATQQNQIDNTSANISGEISDGEILTITGVGLGYSNIDYQFLGGADGHIEQTAETQEDVDFGNWLLNSFAPKQIVSNEQVRSGSKAYYMNVHSNGFGDGSSGKYNGTIRYDFGENIPENTKIYFSWWVKLNVRTKTRDGQWKLFRLVYQNDIQDQGTEFFMSNWPEGDRYLYVNAGHEHNDDSVVLYGNDIYPENDNSWYRMEVALTTSTQGVRDGDIEMYRHHPDTGAITKGHFRRSSGEPEPKYPATKTYETDKRYRYFIWQNYLGNGFTESDVYMDDLYIQVGGFQRIEIGDNPNWDDCTFRDIQPVVSWRDDEIRFKFNKGGLESGQTYYLFLVNENNNPQGSYPITVQ